MFQHHHRSLHLNSSRHNDTSDQEFYQQSTLSLTPSSLSRHSAYLKDASRALASCELIVPMMQGPDGFANLAKNGYFHLPKSPRAYLTVLTHSHLDFCNLLCSFIYTSTIPHPSLVMRGQDLSPFSFCCCCRFPVIPVCSCKGILNKEM